MPLSPLPRRTVLRGLGASMALPYLDAMTPRNKSSGEVPTRMAIILLGMGVNPSTWYPQTAGNDYELTDAFAPIAKHRDDFNIITGTRHVNGSFGNGGHDSGNVFLTGPNSTAESNNYFKNIQSVDQVAADAVGDQTRFSSLQVATSTDTLRTKLSWDRNGVYMQPTQGTKRIFEQLFSGGSQQERIKRREQMRFGKSYIDFIHESASDLHGDLGIHDQRKLDEYLNAVRELEQRLAKEEAWADIPRPESPIPAPAGSRTHSEHIREMYDLMTIAFQTDLTRVIVYGIYGTSANYKFSELGHDEGWHALTHNNGEAEKMARLAEIDRFHMEQFNYLLERMKSVTEADGKHLLHHSMVMQGDGMADGARHWGGNLPLTLAGNGGGRIPTGRHLMFCQPPASRKVGTARGKNNSTGIVEAEVPTNNLYTSMLHAMGVDVPTFGNATGELDGLLS